ncbi:hypothetical protein [Streptomyces sp. NPDC048266]|uniref:zinc finger domain-containing protein n=1 Tax=Streptomyces sp. NPDC048266 TaxID=3155787 RepID=UPI0033EC3099
MTQETGRLECACVTPKLVIEVDGYLYAAIPMTPNSFPTCTCCGSAFTKPWKMGRTVEWRNPDLCGHPKKDGSPCGWVVTDSPCPYHLTPEEKKAEQDRKEERERQERERIVKDRAERREELIEILSVSCPHCSAQSAELCADPKGKTQRAFHKARRQLADCNWVKEYTLQSYTYGRLEEDPPSLNGDPREMLDDPLTDRTAQMTAAHLKRRRKEAERKLQELLRAAWLAAEPRDEAVAAVACAQCGAAPQTQCGGGLRKFKRAHSQRVDAAMAAEGSPAANSDSQIS